ncbi:MAG: hypothetical protein ACRC8Y_12690 [Chroococcales cyanobacterium]
MMITGATLRSSSPHEAIQINRLSDRDRILPFSKLKAPTEVVLSGVQRPDFSRSPVFNVPTSVVLHVQRPDFSRSSCSTSRLQSFFMFNVPTSVVLPVFNVPTSVVRHVQRPDFSRSSGVQRPDFSRSPLG